MHLSQCDPIRLEQRGWAEHGQLHTNAHLRKHTESYLGKNVSWASAKHPEFSEKQPRRHGFSPTQMIPFHFTLPRHKHITDLITHVAPPSPYVALISDRREI